MALEIVEPGKVLYFPPQSVQPEHGVGQTPIIPAFEVRTPSEAVGLATAGYLVIEAQQGTLPDQNRVVTADDPW